MKRACRRGKAANVSTPEQVRTPNDTEPLGFEATTKEIDSGKERENKLHVTIRM
jgi:hypothetical protein